MDFTPGHAWIASQYQQGMVRGKTLRETQLQWQDAAHALQEPLHFAATTLAGAARHALSKPRNSRKQTLGLQETPPGKKRP